MKSKLRFLFTAMIFLGALLASACATHQKAAHKTDVLRDTGISPAPATIITEHYAFAGEIAPFAETMQFLITTKPCDPIPPLDRAIQFHPGMLKPIPSPSKIRSSSIHKPADVSLSIFFPINSSVLGDAEIKKLGLFINALKQEAFDSVTITGHTCSLGPVSYNQKLALQRATTVAHYLKQHGVSVTSVSGNPAYLFSSTDPAKNRRAVITAKPKARSPQSKPPKTKGGGEQTGQAIIPNKNANNPKSLSE